jgi:hypothetical protein
MKNLRQKSEVRSQKPAILIVALWLVPLAAFAASVISTIDAGGGRAASASYTMDGSVGGIGGVSTVVSPPQTLKHGYLGQLTEVSSVSVSGTPAQVNETSTSQLSGMALLDDATVTVLTGGDLTWAVPTWPVQNITGSGLATAAAVFSNTVGSINGRYLGASGSGQLLVLDSLPDNYGSYASDGLPDWWQNQFFGLNNPNAAPGMDVTGTGQNNLFKYVAGLNPTNPASVFVLQIAAVAGQANQKHLIFSPRWVDRTYTPEFCTNLAAGGGFSNLTSIATSDNGTERTVTDTNATENAKFYQIKISYP